MNEEQNNNNNENDAEARVVAFVLGEGSAEERAAVERLLSERPELRSLRDEMAGLHGLLGEAAAIDADAKGTDWRLSDERRRTVLDVLEGEAAPLKIAEREDKPRLPSWNARLLSFGRVAAVLCLILGAGFLALPSVRESSRSSARASERHAKDHHDAPHADQQTSDHPLPSPQHLNDDARYSDWKEALISANESEGQRKFKASLSELKQRLGESTSAGTANGVGDRRRLSTAAGRGGTDGNRLMNDANVLGDIRGSVVTPNVPRGEDGRLNLNAAGDKPKPAVVAPPAIDFDAPFRQGSFGDGASPTNEPRVGSERASGLAEKEASVSPSNSPSFAEGAGFGGGGGAFGDGALGLGSNGSWGAGQGGNAQKGSGNRPLDRGVPPPPQSPTPSSGLWRAETGPRSDDSSRLVIGQGVNSNAGILPGTALGVQPEKPTQRDGTRSLSAGEIPLPEVLDRAIPAAIAGSSALATERPQGLDADDPFNDRSGYFLSGAVESPVDSPEASAGRQGRDKPASAPVLASPLGRAFVESAPLSKSSRRSDADGDLLGDAEPSGQSQDGYGLAAGAPAPLNRRVEESLPSGPVGRSAPPRGELNEKSAEDEAFSTFSLHVSDVSFQLARAALAGGRLPDPARVRVEEFVNAFDYRDPTPSESERVACRLEQAVHPFLQQRNLMRVSLRTAAAGRASETPLRLTLLLDNSGSMERIDRRQTVRRAFALLAEQLTPIDRVTLISFARRPRLLADGVVGDRAQGLVRLVEELPSEGGTNLESALRLAFEKAKEQQAPGVQSRVILLTDGAVNLGDADPRGLAQTIAAMRDAGVAFDAAGVCADGLNDEVLEALTRNGDGRYYLLDRPGDADDGFAQQIAGALRPAAKNVKVQVEFNPKRVGRYKLLGFEKHRLKKEDFRNDRVDAAELAAAEAGVALYQFEARPEGEGDVGSVSVRFLDTATGRVVENRWPIPYEPNAVRIDRAAPPLRVAAAAGLLAAKLRGDPLSAAVDLKTLSSMVNGLPDRVRGAERVEQLRQMIQQARRLTGN